MKKNRNTKHEETGKYVKKAGSGKVISYEVLEAAQNGDAEAMMEIVNHYSGVIQKMAVRRGCDAEGFPIYYVDETLRRRLETAVIMAVTTKFVIA